MQKAVPVGKGKMIAVLGTKIKDIKDLLRLNVDSSICERWLWKELSSQTRESS